MRLLLGAMVVSLMLLSLPAFAKGDPSAGQAKSAICAACHGMDGNSTVPTWPKLAGQHEQYLVRQVSLIKSGARMVQHIADLIPQPRFFQRGLHNVIQLGLIFGKSVNLGAIGDVIVD